MKKDLIQLVLSGIWLAIHAVWFLSSPRELLTVMIGVNLGVGFAWAFLYALKLIRPDKYRFMHEVNETETA